MKNKELLAKEFVKAKGIVDFELKISYENMFKWGFEAAYPKWNSVLDILPEDDRTVLVWVDNTETPEWSGYKLGTYIGNWYCVNGRNTQEIVTKWMEIPSI